MKTVFRFTALALAVSANVGVSSAAYHPLSFGKYSTAVAESRLFVNDAVTTLRCDLHFSAGDSDTKWLAPKGSVVSQTVPSFVWQYSGLLPISDYLKTVAIHSVRSDQKESAWQDVQLTFYKGLRAEGAREVDAKIAYAGAYAFAPRWPLVELVDITVPERDKETRLYKVEYIPASEKGVSIDEYRSIARDIHAAPEAVTLQDIRGIVDAADAKKAADADKAANKRSLFSFFFKNKKSPDKSPEKDPLNDLFIDQAIPAVNIGDASSSGTSTGVSVDVEVLEEEAVEILGLNDSEVESGVENNSEVEGVAIEVEELVHELSPMAGGTTGTGDEDGETWKTLPDGSEILMKVGG